MGEFSAVESASPSDETRVFHPWCSKCGSRDVSTYKDRVSGWNRTEQTAVFHCNRCGKTLYGEAAVAETHRQHTEWENHLRFRATTTPKPDPVRDFQREHTRTLLASYRQEAARLVDEADRWAGAVPKWDSPSGEYQRLLNLLSIDVANVHLRHDELAEKVNPTAALAELTAMRQKVARMPPAVARLTELREAGIQERLIEEQRLAEEARQREEQESQGLVRCAFCGKSMTRLPYQIKRNKSGLFFCCHKHHQTWIVEHQQVGQPLRT